MNLFLKALQLPFVGNLNALVIIFLLTSCQKGSPDSGFSTWTHYGGSPEQSRYFEANYITKENVNQLEVAWIYPTEDETPYFFSPIIVDTVMYVMGKNSSLIAVNVRNGKEIWIHANLNGLTRRGINYWESKDKKDKRLIFTINNTIQAINAETGESILSFGRNGYVDLREGVGREPSSIRRIQPMMPGVIFEDLLIIGSAPGENYFSAPGHVRAYNVVTGKMEWIFHTLPQPGEFGYETWPKDAYQYVGGVNVWSEISVDSKRGIAYLPVGSPTYDYYGADRIGSNLFGNSLVAVDARTGKRLWHFQTVHHDLWDYDLASAPQLLTVKHKGKKIDAVAVATKHGFVFVFDRVTGEPLFPIEEKPFPPSEMPGEEAWPTQPIPSLPTFTRNEVTKETLNPYFPDSIKQFWYKRVDEAKSGLYTPLSDKHENITMPGALGGANYGNTASNPTNGMMYILTQEHASIYRLNKVEPPKIDLSSNDLQRVHTLYNSTCQTCHGKDMAGGSAPALRNAGQYLFYDEFRNTVINGKGQMPGFVHVDEEILKAMYRYIGGNPATMNFRRNLEPRMPDGPVVASGGATIIPDESKVAPMSDYPEGVDHPPVRYTTDYGLDWPGLAAPPWSSLVAYDLNEGTIAWRRPVGQDSLYVQGDQSKGAPGGVLRKGMIVTSTGIVFSTAKGGKLYAIDADNGEILWEETLSHEVNAQPSMYVLDGRQYLVINATSNFARDSYNHSKKPGALPKGYVVYALPERK
ncbi:PQQ-binding-like beta-propeller repeat protein [Cecembia rubra]|uniref:Quinoprotein glucose dehydrogenase n=1 Tax=Cecembia rubra TaxID=1485585 RepID=A0A2P8E1H5_9BACT|nr:PQQ-binding-like beta-propeller repeat protein [Cecembia rubra]PSL03299.1 quinoprotein glucose dehydrogenase [Cecembia rubra]